MGLLFRFFFFTGCPFLQGDPLNMVYFIQGVPLNIVYLIQGVPKNMVFYKHVHFNSSLHILLNCNLVNHHLINSLILTKWIDHGYNWILYKGCMVTLFIIKYFDQLNVSELIFWSRCHWIARPQLIQISSRTLSPQPRYFWWYINWYRVSQTMRLHRWLFRI